MARIRQQFPQNYGSSGNISTEFENMIRYLNTAELGNKTIGELLAKLFDTDGNFDGPVEFQRSLAGNLEYRIGEYADDSAGWVVIASPEDLRGEPGVDIGSLNQPIYYGRTDVTATAAQTVFNYVFATTDELLVYLDGVLQTGGGSADYEKDQSTGTVTFTSAMAGGEVVTLLKIRNAVDNGYVRTDFTTADAQAVFAYVHDEDDTLTVYFNGILQREGGSYDYTTSPASNTITLTSATTAGNLLTVIESNDVSATTLSGIMTEADFVDTATGLILLNKIGIASGAISQASVANLATDLAASAKLTVAGTAPVSPATGNLWHDTSTSPNELKYYDGTQWLRTSPESSLPTFTAANANQVLRVNGTGTALEFAAVDLSSVIPKTEKGAASGIATLDGNARLPTAQLPEVLSSQSLFLEVTTPADQTYDIKRIYKQKLRIQGLAIRTSAGTCNVQVSVNGVTYGTVYTASSVPNEVTLGTPIEIDASASSAMIQFAVTSNAASANLEVVLACSVLSS